MAAELQRTSQTSAQLRAEIERTRLELNRSLEGLRRDVTSRTDWRRWVRERPLPMLAGAFAVGFLLGSRR